VGMDEEQNYKADEEYTSKLEDEKTVGKEENQIWRWRNHKPLTAASRTISIALFVTHF